MHTQMHFSNHTYALRCICTTDSVEARHICMIAHDEDAVQMHIASICIYVEDAVHMRLEAQIYIGLDLSI